MLVTSLGGIGVNLLNTCKWHDGMMHPSILRMHCMLPSNRKFGALFTIILAIAGVNSLLKDSTGNVSIYFYFTASIVTCFITILAPRLLSPLNLLWFKLGQLLGKIFNPIVFGMIFFFIITPIAILARMSGHDELRLKKKQATSYWVTREYAVIEPETFNNQF
jgi:hypothetical protein